MAKDTEERCLLEAVGLRHVIVQTDRSFAFFLDLLSEPIPLGRHDGGPCVPQSLLVCFLALDGFGSDEQVSQSLPDTSQITGC